jgi:hypothetical protein
VSGEGAVRLSGETGQAFQPCNLKNLFRVVATFTV